MPTGQTAIDPSLWQGDPALALPSKGASQPAGLEALIDFNTITINDRSVVDKYRVTKLDGFKGLSVRANAETNPSDHGETPLENLFDGRTMMISGRIEAHNIAKLRDMEMALRSGFQVLKEKALVLRTHNPSQANVYINARTIDKIDIPEVQGSDSLDRDFMITLRASDPRFYSVETKTSDINISSVDDFAMGKDVIAVNQVGNPFPATTIGWSPNGGTISAPGNGITRHTATGAGNQGPYYSGASAGGPIQVTGGQTYTASLKLNAFPAGRTFTFSIEWRDASFNVLDVSSLSVSAPQAMARYALTGVAPIGATQVYVTFYHTSSVNGDVLDTSEWMFCDGNFSSPFFVPGDGHSKFVGANAAPAISAYMPRLGLTVQARNLVLNPTPQATTGFSALNATSSIPVAGNIRATLTAGGVGGLYYGGGANSVFIPVVAGQTYNFSVKLVSGPAGRTYTQQISWRNGASGTISTSVTTATTITNGSRVNFSAVAPAGATQALPVFYMTNAVNGDVFDSTEWALNDSADQVPAAFVNGDSYRSHWLGTAHASQSEYFADDYDDQAGFVSVPSSSWHDSDNFVIGNGVNRFYRSGNPQRVSDSAFTSRIKTPSLITTGEEIGVIMKSLDLLPNFNGLTGRVQAQSATTAQVAIVRTTNNTPSTLAASSNFTIAPSTTYWLKTTLTGSSGVVTVALYSGNDPDSGLASTLLGSVSHTMTGATLTLYGGNTLGTYGLRTNTTRNYRLGAFNMRSPVVYNADIIRVAHAGNFYAEPKIRFYGPMTSPVVTNQTPGVDEDFTRTVSITGSIPAGRYYEFDSKKGTLYDNLGANKISQLAVSSKPLRLRDGENIVGLSIPSFASVSFESRVQFIYQDTWI